MSDVYDTFGTLLKRGDGAGIEVFATIGGVGDIDGPKEEVKMEEYLAHDHTDRTIRRYPTVVDNGVISFPLYWDPADAIHILLRGDFEARSKSNYQLVESFTGGETAAFAAYISKLGKAYPIEGLMTCEVELAIDGAIAWS